jgi:hypothetical protein
MANSEEQARSGNGIEQVIPSPLRIGRLGGSAELHGNQTGDGVAHWAHPGGFISGVVIALGLLIARQASAHDSDILSMSLGPRAWKIIGPPVSAAVE